MIRSRDNYIIVAPAAKVRSTTIIQLILLNERVYWGVRLNVRVMELCSPRQYRH